MAEDERPEPDRRGMAPHPRFAVELFGQKTAEQQFVDASRAGRLHHAWMITGPSGTGKATLAWRIARFVLSGTGSSNLGIERDHPVYRQVSQLAAPGLYLCRRPWDAKLEKLKTVVTVEEVRQLKSFFQVTSADGGWRVAVIDSIDEFTPSAANALLKLLEEPPQKALFLIVCHRPAKVLPTVRSRCRELVCRPLNDEAVQSALLQAGAAFDELDPKVLTMLSNGSVGDAWDLLAHSGSRIFEDILEILGSAPDLNRDRIAQLIKSCSTGSPPERFQLIYRMAGFAFSRLALAGAGVRMEPVSGLEKQVASRLGTNAAQARIWAEATPEITARAEMARRLNLDPEQVLFDTFVQIEAAANKSLQQLA